VSSACFVEADGGFLESQVADQREVVGHRLVAHDLPQGRLGLHQPDLG
jgi:hypothetical protein